jgi:glycosyltransferase involved in cell wall biosynthesis
MSDRKVAVIIPCHNHARILPDAINSVLGQTLRPAEILVVDDASADRTIQVAQQHCDQGVRYLRVEHRCPYQTRRTGLNATSTRPRTKTGSSGAR